LKYALISDIHGNLPALEAVLNDARRHNADKFVFVGDYIEDFPWPNEVAETIRLIPSAVVVRGNKEDYLMELQGTDQRTWTLEQYAPIYWNYRTLTPENLGYLVSLPEEAEIRDEGGVLRLSHKSDLYTDKPRMLPFYSSHYRVKMKTSPMTHEDYLSYARAAVHKHQDITKALARRPGDVLVFGHNHLQWHMTLGDKLLVNPGSCGFPLDFNTDAPYTLIEYDKGVWQVTERRVSYDIEATIQALYTSTLYEQAEVFCSVVIRSLRRAEDCLSTFFGSLRETADAQGCRTWPVPNDILRLAYDKWRRADET
jgi:predicted phosphodiesterase